MNALEQLIRNFKILKFKIFFFKLSKQDQLIFLKEYFTQKYDLKEILSEQFYDLLLKKIEKDIGFLITNKDIYQIIVEIKGLTTINEILKMEITPTQYFEIQNKKVLQLKSMLEKLSKEYKENNLDKMFAKEMIYFLANHACFTETECYILAYKLYLTIGFENAKELIEQRYGEVSFKTLYFLFNGIDTKNVKIQKGIPILKEEFVNFFFTNKKSLENTMHLLLEGYYKNIYLNFPYFYQNFEIFQKKLGNKMPKTKVESLLEERFKCSFYPEISGDILLDFKPSFQSKYQFYSFSEKEITKLNYEFYEKNIKKQYLSTIPQINYRTQDGLTCEIISKSSSRNLVIGYRTGSCFRINGDASILFSKAMISKHYRVLSVSTSKEKDIAMCLLVRNGNVIVIQGIEISKSYQTMEMRAKIYEAIRETMQELIEKMNTERDSILAILIGNSNENVTDFSQRPLSFRITPIKSPEENLEYFYDGFHFPQSILVMNKNANLNNIKLYVPTIEYYDNREEILHWQKGEDYNYYYYFIQKRLAKISFEANVQLRRIEAQSTHKEEEIYCNKDWYLIVVPI